MKLEKDSYTKEEVQEILKEYNTKIEDFTTKLNDSNSQLENLDKQKKQIESLTKSNLENSIKVEMLKNGLSEDMFDLVADSKDLDAATNKINKLLDLKKKSDVSNGYKPTEHNAQQTAYEEAQKKNDVAGMLKAKMSKLFK
jgi:DNA repair ATPase RecN